jgi:hypothetical protein
MSMTKMFTEFRISQIESFEHNKISECFSFLIRTESRLNGANEVKLRT